MKRLLSVISALSILTTSFVAFADTRGLEVSVRPFEFNLNTEGVELSGIAAKVVCRQNIYQSPMELVFSQEALVKLVNLSGGRRTYLVSSPEFKGLKAKKISSWYGICSLQYEFVSADKKSRGVFALGPLDSKNDYHNMCANHALTTEDVLGFQFVQSPQVIGKFSENCPAYFKFYENAQAKMSQIILRPLAGDSGRIAIAPSVDYQQKFFMVAQKAEQAFEVYWRKIRNGEQTESHAVVITERGGHAGLAIGGLIGVGIGVLYNKALVGLVVGGLVGSLHDTSAETQVAMQTQALPLPQSATDLETDIFAFKVLEEGRSWAVEKLVSGSDIDTYKEILNIYTTLMTEHKALTPEMIANLKSMKAAYSPKADKLFDLILNTPYETQGACVGSASCDKRIIL